MILKNPRQLSIIALLCAFVFAWCAATTKLVHIRKQREAVRAIERSGGWVVYDFEGTNGGGEDWKPPFPAWLSKRLGKDFFATVIRAQVVGDDGLKATEGLPHLISLTVTEYPLEHETADLGEYPLTEDEVKLTPEQAAALQRLEHGKTSNDEVERKILLQFTARPISPPNLPVPVTNRGARYLDQLLELQELKINSSHINDDGLKSIARLTRLQRLLLRCDITDAGIQQFEQLTDMRHVDLGGVNVGDTGIRHLKLLTRLEELSLIGTKITDAALEDIAELKKLKFLHLSATNITDRGIEHCEELPNIELLDLEGTHITNDSLARLKHLDRLRVLNLSRTLVSDAGLGKLVVLTHLQELDLRCTQVSDDGVTRIRQKLPNCKVEGP